MAEACGIPWFGWLLLAPIIATALVMFLMVTAAVCFGVIAVFVGGSEPERGTPSEGAG